MAPHVYLDALNKALDAELLQRGGSDSSGRRRRSRAIAALLFGAGTVVGRTEELPVVAPIPAPSAAQMTGTAAIVPAHFRPAADRSQIIGRVLATAQTRVETDAQPAQAVATLAIEIGKLQHDMAIRSPDGMEEWIGEEYASLEAVRRALADTVADDEEPALVAVALDRAAQLFCAAA